MYPKDTWKDKTVFCNGNDAVSSETKEEAESNANRNTSAFSRYFIQHFYELGLKKLICTHYSGVVGLLRQETQGAIFTKESHRTTEESPIGYNGSFDHPLSLKILQDVADIVCTNPPFSRAIDYWKMIMESGKKFLIISNITNPITSAFIGYFKDRHVWAGYNRVDWYLSPQKELIRAAGTWYTNIPIDDRPKYNHLKFVPIKEIPEKYKKYDDSQVLLVDYCYIPVGYRKPFAVSARSILNGLLEKGYEIIQDKSYVPHIKGKALFSRVLVQKRS